MYNIRTHLPLSKLLIMKFPTTLVLSAVLFLLVLTAVATANQISSPFGTDKLTVDKRQSCSGYSYTIKIGALECTRAYLEAVREEIENSTCRNSYFIYHEDDDPLVERYTTKTVCERPRDAREDVRNCSGTCSARQRYYLLCSLLLQGYESVKNECGSLPQEVDYCLFDKGDFCFLMGPMSTSLLVDCYATLDLSSYDVQCSESCRQAVDTYMSTAGCCVEYWQDHKYDPDGYSYSSPSIAQIFSACEVEIPEACTFGRPPPREFLDCARESTAEQQSAAERGVPTSWLVTAVGLLFVTLIPTQ